jgi:hypothetical protein
MSTMYYMTIGAIFGMIFTLGFMVGKEVKSLKTRVQELECKRDDGLDKL